MFESKVEKKSIKICIKRRFRCLCFDLDTPKLYFGVVHFLMLMSIFTLQIFWLYHNKKPMNHLYYGDNLDIMRRYIDKESVDLVYLDPPFNSSLN